MCLSKRMMIMSNTDMRLQSYFHFHSLKAFLFYLSLDSDDEKISHRAIIPIHLLYSKIKFLLLLPLFAYLSGHPHFFNQLSCGLDIVSMAGEVCINPIRTCRREPARCQHHGSACKIRHRPGLYRPVLFGKNFIFF